MNTVKLGINGLGRIGRTILRSVVARHLAGQDRHIEIVAANNPGNPETLTHLLRYDSIHGTFPTSVEFRDQNFLLGGEAKVHLFGEKDPSQIDWSKLGVDVVIDATGVFKDKSGLGKHLGGSVKKVIMCAPGKDLDGTFVMGINNDNYSPESDHIISNASCTTNCLAPVAKVIDEAFGIENGFMTTVHAYTSDQNILDANHRDLRRARAAAMNMIPTSTGAAKALGEVIPNLKGKLDGFAVRVPTSDVSMVDLTVNVKKDVSVADINRAMKEASEGNLKGVLGYTDEELVSQDFLGRPESSIFDSPLTNVIGRTVKVVSWYDNEAGFSQRVVDLANFIGQQL